MCFDVVEYALLELAAKKCRSNNTIQMWFCPNDDTAIIIQLMFSSCIYSVLWTVHAPVIASYLLLHKQSRNKCATTPIAYSLNDAMTIRRRLRLRPTRQAKSDLHTHTSKSYKVLSYAPTTYSICSTLKCCRWNVIDVANLYGYGNYMLYVLG